MKKLLILFFFILSLISKAQEPQDFLKNYVYDKYTKWVGVRPSTFEKNQPKITQLAVYYGAYLQAMYSADQATADSALMYYNAVAGTSFTSLPYSTDTVGTQAQILALIQETNDSLTSFYLQINTLDSTVTAFGNTLTDTLGYYSLTTDISDSLSILRSLINSNIDDTIASYVLITTFVDSLNNIRGDIAGFVTSTALNDTLAYYWTGNVTNDSINAKIARAGISNLDDTLAYYYLGSRVDDSIASAITALTYIDYTGTPLIYEIPFMSDANTLQTNSQFRFTNSTRTEDAVYLGTQDPNSSTRINWNYHVYAYEINSMNGLNVYYPYAGSGSPIEITTPTLNATQTSPYINISRTQNYGSRSLLGDIFYIDDSPVTVGTKGGAILRVLVDGTLRTLIDPRGYYDLGFHEWGTSVDIGTYSHTIWKNQNDTLMRLDTTGLYVDNLFVDGTNIVDFIVEQSEVDSTWDYVTINEGILLNSGDTLKDIYHLNDSVMAVLNEDTVCISGCRVPYIISSVGDTLKGVDCIDVNCDSAYVLINNRTLKITTNTTGTNITGSESVFDGWDKDVSNDFNGAYASLTGLPNLEDSVLLYEDDSTFLKSVAYLIDSGDTTAWNAVINAIDSLGEDLTPDLMGDLNINNYDFVGDVRMTAELEVVGNTYFNTSSADSTTIYGKLTIINGLNRLIAGVGGITFPNGNTLVSVYPLNDSVMAVVNTDTVCISGCYGTGGGSGTANPQDIVDSINSIVPGMIEDSLAAFSVNYDTIGIVLDVDLTGGTITQINTNQSISQPKVISIVDTLFNEYEGSFDIQYRLSTTWFIDIYSATSYDSLTIFYIKDDAGVDSESGGGSGTVTTSGTPVAGQMAIFTDASTVGGSDSLTADLFFVDNPNKNLVFGSTKIRNTLTPGLGQGVNNASFGLYANLSNLTTGSRNSMFGVQTGGQLTTGNRNNGFGNAALGGNITNNDNNGFGCNTLAIISSGSANTAMGGSSLNGMLTGNNNIGLGYTAGKYITTQSNRLFINSLDRTNLLSDTTLSIIYGIQAATTANQKLYFNANVNVAEDLTVDGNTTLGDASTDITTVNGVFKHTQLSASLTDGTPTDAEIDSATGTTPATVGAGYQVTIKDSDGTGLLYKVESDGTNWYYIVMTQAL